MRRRCRSVQETIEKRIVKTGDCWIWLGEKYKDGYGRIRINWKKYAAHRVAYELYVGPIPSGLCVLHKCDNKPCINPDHLFLGTKADNAHDRDKKGRTVLHLENLKWTPTRQNVKLSKDQVIEIRHDARLQSVIASAYGISQTNVSAIKNRQIWRHI